jgi:nicotinate-nucleotide adenylyltransferase
MQPAGIHQLGKESGASWTSLATQFEDFEAAMRLGVFGGTFDPIHLGHLIVAEQCREQARLDLVLFIPAARPPHKQEQPLTPFVQRAEMLALALAGQPAFRVEELEKDRPGPSYTADTLAELQRQYAGAELFLIVGADTLADLPSWHEPARIAEQATLLVVGRPGWNEPPPETLRAALHLPEANVLRQQTIAAPLIAIRSRDLRQRVAEGRSIRYLTPRAVEVYIAEKGLYRQA